MSHLKFVNTAFDPNQCPLLQGLSPEEQQVRMREDPIIRNCMAHTRDSGAYPSVCDHLNSPPSADAPGRKGKVKAPIVA